MLIEGSCHCGNLGFTLVWEPSPQEIPARACGCSFCSSHGGVWTSTRDGSLQIRVNDPSLLSRYAFETQTADFLVCRRCGVVPIVTCDIDGRIHAVVNVNTFRNVPPSLLRRTAATFEAERAATRLGRRQASWIADVRFVPAPVCVRDSL